MNKYKYLLFDLDGTLADTDPLIIQTMYDLYDKYNNGKRKSIEEIYYFSGPPIRDTLRQEFPHVDIDLIYKDFHDISYQYYKTHIFLFNDEVEILDELVNEGYKLGVVTNKQHDLALFALEILGIDKYFEIIVGANDVKKTKPYPDGINLALNMLKCYHKEEAIYIGDNRSDYLTSLNAHIDSMLVNWGPRKLKDVHPIKLVSSYKELGEFFK